MISKELSDRIRIIKWLMIVMVVYIHSSKNVIPYNGIVDQSIGRTSLMCFKYCISQSLSRVAVPMLFLISSILLYLKDFTWSSNIRKKIKSVLIPYIIWNTFWIGFSFAAQSIDFLASYYPRDSYYIRGYDILDWIEAYTYLNGNYPYLYTLWFLRDLFILNFFAIIIKKLVDRFPLTILIALATLWISNFSIPYLDNQAIVFFVLGYYVVKFKIIMQIEKLDKLNLRIHTFTYIVFILLDYFFSYNLFFIHQINVVFGIFYFIRLSGCLLHSKTGVTMAYLSKYSIIIYVLHEMSLSMLNSFFNIFIPQTLIVEFLLFILLPIIIISLCLLFGRIVENVLPLPYAFVTGGRKG